MVLWFIEKFNYFLGAGLVAGAAGFVSVVPTGNPWAFNASVTSLGKGSFNFCATLIEILSANPPGMIQASFFNTHVYFCSATIYWNSAYNFSKAFQEAARPSLIGQCIKYKSNYKYKKYILYWECNKICTVKRWCFWYRCATHK